MQRRGTSHFVPPANGKRPQAQSGTEGPGPRSNLLPVVALIAITGAVLYGAFKLGQQSQTAVDVVMPPKVVIGMPVTDDPGHTQPIIPGTDDNEETGSGTQTGDDTDTEPEPVQLHPSAVATGAAVQVTVRRIIAANSNGAQFEGKWPQAMQYCPGQGTNGLLTAGSRAAPDCDGLLRVISISLYGGNPRYTTGAIRNSEAVRDAFPDWKLWVYIPDPSSNPNWEVPADVKERLIANGARLITVDKATIDAVGFGMNQRFLTGDDPTVDMYAVRDGDSRMLLRERWTLDEWEASEKPFHVLRDHPSHSNFHISGGLWGARRGALTDVRTLLSNARSAGTKNNYLDDMNFLNNDVWPIMTSKGVYQHDAFSCRTMGDNAHGFPYRRAGGEHVGGVYDAQDVIREGDVGLLPRQSPPECESPVYEPADRKPVRVTGSEVKVESGVRTLGQAVLRVPWADDEREIVGLVLFEWQKVFIDPVSPACGEKTGPPLPSIFDYKRIFTSVSPVKNCPPPPTSAVSQYHQRVPWGQTHYTAFGSGGLKYSHHLLYIEALYHGNPYVQAAFGIPVLLHYLMYGPPAGRVLVPSASKVNMDTIVKLRLNDVSVFGVHRHVNSPNTAPSTWALDHVEAPALYWAHRLYVAALGSEISDGMNCGVLSCPLANHDCVTTLIAMHAVTALVDKQLQRQLHARVEVTQGCSAVLVLPPLSSPLLSSALTDTLTAAGYSVTVLDSCDVTLDAQAEAMLHADVVVMPPLTVVSTQFLMRRTSQIIVVDALLQDIPEESKTATSKAAMTASCARLGLDCIHIGGEMPVESVNAIITKAFDAALASPAVRRCGK